MANECMVKNDRSQVCKWPISYASASADRLYAIGISITTEPGLVVKYGRVRKIHPIEGPVPIPRGLLVGSTFDAYSFVAHR